MTNEYRSAALIISPLRKSEGTLKIDFPKAAKAIGAIVGLAFGLRGIPSLVSAAPDILKAVTREVGSDRKAETQGFSLYTSALVASIGSLLDEFSPFTANQISKSELSALVTAALCKEPVELDRRFLHRPALNPGFLRVKESLLQVLESPAVGVDASKADKIGNLLGSRFAASLGDTVQLLKNKKDFEDFFARLDENPFESPMSRGWIWDDYRSAINRKIYQRLFLHEMEDHPDAVLADLYVPSRATYDIQRNFSDDPGKVLPTEIKVVDLANNLTKEWLSESVAKAGVARLITGDPGCGKSTFSLMFAKHLLDSGWRVLLIPANSIRSLTLSLRDIVSIHLQHSLKLEKAPEIDAELADPEATGKPLLIILDGLDEYDQAGMTISNAAALLADHATQVVEEWTNHDYMVRLLLCGRPEAASGLSAKFRDSGRHLHMTGFVVEDLNKNYHDVSSKLLLSEDQRDIWWKKWQLCCRQDPVGIPGPILQSTDVGVREITSQPLLNYMLAVLRLYERDNLTNLSGLYGQLFDRYYERQSSGKSPTFEALCPNVDRFRRIMSEIGIAAWHAGDRSVSVNDLKDRFNRPPLKSWFSTAKSYNAGLGAILSAFYTKPEDSSIPQSGIAEHYIFTHKSFREYLTAVGVVRFLDRLAENLDQSAEDGWSDEQALAEWLALFGPTAMDQRQWEFLQTELSLFFEANRDKVARIKQTLERIFELSLARKMPLPLQAADQETCLLRWGNAEEAILLALSAVRVAVQTIVELRHRTIKIKWNKTRARGDELESPTQLREFVSRIRSRPGYHDGNMLAHIYCVTEEGGEEFNEQVGTIYNRRADGWEYASVIDFSGANLTAANFSGAMMPYSRFHRTYLVGANFNDARLQQSDFCYSTARDPLFIDEHGVLSFENAVLNGSNLDDVEWSRVQFNGADLERAKMDEANIDVSTIPTAARIDEWLMERLHVEGLGGAGEEPIARRLSRRRRE